MTTLIQALVLAAASTGGGGSGEPEPTWAQQNQMTLFMLLIGFLVLMYFMMIGGPERRKRQERESMISAMAKGDRVVSIGGVHGKIVRLDKEAQTVVVNVAKDVDIEFSQQAISGVTPSKAEGKRSGK